MAKQKSKKVPVEERVARKKDKVEAISQLREYVHNELMTIELSRVNLMKPGLYLPPSWTPIFLEQPGIFYKVVAAVDGKLVSVFDGVTEYNLGKWTLSKRGAVGWPPLETCYYGFPTPHLAVTAEFPANSKHLGAPKILLQIQAKGRAYRKDGDVWAFCAVKPTLLISDITEGKTYIISSRDLGLPGL